MAKISTTAMVVGSFGLVVIAGFWLLVLPQIKKMSSQNDQITQLNESNQNLVNDTQKQQQQQNQLVKDTALADVLLPNDQQQYDLSIQVEAMMKNLGMPITSFAITAPNAANSGTATSGSGAAASGPNKKLILALGTTGSYPNIQRVIQGLTHLNRFIQLDQFTISQGSTQTVSTGQGATPAPPDPNQLNAQISAFAYFLPTSGSK